MHARNYMEQYSRTKSIHQISKHRNSYKLLTEHSKLLQTNTQMQKELAKIDKSNSKSSFFKEPEHTTKAKKSKILQEIFEPPKNQNYTSIKDQNFAKDLKIKMKGSVERSCNSVNSNKLGLSKERNKILSKSHKSQKRPIYNKSISRSKNDIETQPQSQYSSKNFLSFQEIYERVKKMSEIHIIKEKQWIKEKQTYQQRIKELEQKLKRKSCNVKKNSCQHKF